MQPIRRSLLTPLTSKAHSATHPGHLSALFQSSSLPLVGVCFPLHIPEETTISPCWEHKPVRLSLLSWFWCLKVTILSYHKFYIYAELNHYSFPGTWIMICGYGPPDSQDKREFWSSLEHVVINLTEPSWLGVILVKSCFHQRKLVVGVLTTTSTSRNYLGRFLENAGMHRLRI